MQVAIRLVSFAAILWAASSYFVPALCGDETAATAEELRAAIRRAIPLIEAGSAGSAEHRTCFTCHSQAVPVLALAAAQARGFKIDVENFKRQIQHTAKHLERGRKGYLAGKGQGGRVVTAGYALWALAAGGEKPNENTEAVTSYLLKHQSKQNYWSQASQRPPSSGSNFTNTYLGLRALATFGTDHQQPQIEKRARQVRSWLLETVPADTEDRAFRLRALRHVDADADALRSAIDELVSTQRDDGGWSQLDDTPSDAYATATVLAAFIEAGKLPADHPAVQRGIRYLLNSQLDDGTWHVATRAKGFQTYFETGFPHGPDQFISTAASAWSLLSLVLVLPEAE